MPGDILVKGGNPLWLERRYHMFVRLLLLKLLTGLLVVEPFLVSSGSD